MDIKALADKYNDYIIERRRYYHTCPELSNEEKETRASLHKDLEAMGITDIKEMEHCYGMIATIHGDLPVKKGQKLAGTRIIPLVIEQEKMDAMQAAAGSEPILNVLPFHPKKFAVITTGSEVFKGRIEDKFTPILVGKLAEYGCEMTYHKTCDDDPAGILEAKAAGCELIFTTGGMSVDPDDRTPLAIKNTGAEIITYGAPVLPGAMFLVSYLDGVPVCGLPGCVMYAKRTIFDLLLPRLLADDPITAEDIARLGEGGLCLGCAECHWPNCGFGHC